MTHDRPTFAADDFPFTFHGSYTRAVDGKGRFNLPFRFRRGGPADEDERYVLTKGADGGLALFPHEVWQTNFRRIGKTYSGAQMREYLRRMSEASHMVTPDSQGRIAVPADFLQAGGLGKKVTVVGLGDYMELWDPDQLEVKLAAPAVDQQALTDEFFR